VISPDNSVLVIGSSGDVNNNFIAGFDPANGSENWRETLPLENGLGQFVTTRARFSPDSQLAFLHTATADGPNSRSFLYALNAALNPANATPHAVASADRTAGRAPITIYFSSANSFDPDGTVVSRHWDFGDGASSDEANPAHVYSSAGTYNAKLTVTDNLGATNETFVQLQFTSGGCVTNCARVTVLSLSAAPASGNFRVAAAIRVQNELGQPIANASVKVIWDTPSAGPAFTRTVITNSEGWAESAVTSIAGPYTVGTVTIENIPGYTFDEGNSVRFASITAGP
jgi:chitodextrinase